jgi:MFS superfamily sulfate permease-like transporter
VIIIGYYRYILSNLTGTDYYRDSGRYRRVTPLGDGIIIFRFDAPLLFTNVEHFQNSILKALAWVCHRINLE